MFNQEHPHEKIRKNLEPARSSLRKTTLYIYKVKDKVNHTHHMYFVG